MTARLLYAQSRRDLLDTATLTGIGWPFKACLEHLTPGAYGQLLRSVQPQLQDHDPIDERTYGLSRLFLDFDWPAVVPEAAIEAQEKRLKIMIDLAQLVKAEWEAHFSGSKGDVLVLRSGEHRYRLYAPDFVFAENYCVSVLLKLVGLKADESAKAALDVLDKAPTYGWHIRLHGTHNSKGVGKGVYKIVWPAGRIGLTVSIRPSESQWLKAMLGDFTAPNSLVAQPLVPADPDDAQSMSQLAGVGGLAPSSAPNRRDSPSAVWPERLRPVGDQVHALRRGQRGQQGACGGV